MSPLFGTVEIIVTAAGVGAILFALWFFFRNPGISLRGSDQPFQEVVISMNSKLDPRTVVLAQGLAAKLRFRNDVSELDPERLTIPGLDVERTLPGGKTTTIDLQVDEAGVFDIATSSGLQGSIIVIPTT